jgi:hypothetical protein
VPVRILRPGDEDAVDRFLAGHADTSMFLRSNLRAVGLRDRGESQEGTYAASFEGGGAIAGVAAHCWNGIVLVQAPDPHVLGDVVRAATAATAGWNRSVTGIVGPLDQVVAARAALGLDRAVAASDEAEDLFVLDLESLVVPAALASGAVSCRATREGDLALCAEWREGYLAEAFGFAKGAELAAQSKRDALHAHRRSDSWILEAGGERVSYSAFNAKLPDMVQVGGVWTPPEKRGRGFARCAVAGSLLDARARGARRAILFTGEGNVAARTAYLALGFTIVGRWGLVLFPRRSP